MNKLKQLGEYVVVLAVVVIIIIGSRHLIGDNVNLVYSVVR